MAEPAKDDSIDWVSHPPHYTNHPSGVETIEITGQMSFCLGNAVKYVMRSELKNGVEDLKKARFYLVWHRDHPLSPHGHSPRHLLNKVAKYESNRLKADFFKFIADRFLADALETLDALIAEAEAAT